MFTPTYELWDDGEGLWVNQGSGFVAQVLAQEAQNLAFVLARRVRVQVDVCGSWNLPKFLGSTRSVEESLGFSPPGVLVFGARRDEDGGVESR